MENAWFPGDCLKLDWSGMSGVSDSLRHSEIFFTGSKVQTSRLRACGFQAQLAFDVWIDPPDGGETAGLLVKCFQNAGVLHVYLAAA